MVDSFRMTTHQNSNSAWPSLDASDAGDVGGAAAGVAVRDGGDGGACAVAVAGGAVGRPSWALNRCCHHQSSHSSLIADGR